MKHALYRLNNTKIAFENHCPIDVKLFQPTFNYQNFHTLIYFIKWIWDYGSIINYNTTYNKAAHKYFLKAFYRQTNKKEYESQVLKHNICYTNVIAIQNAILIVQVLDKSVQKNSFLLTCLMQRSCGYVMQHMFY